MVEAARLTIAEFDGDLSNLLRLPAKEALKQLMRFPMIGQPGAEKILLFSGLLPVLALESNGLRVLIRLGFGTEDKSYSTMYRSVQGATAANCPKTASS